MGVQDITWPRESSCAVQSLGVEEAGSYCLRTVQKNDPVSPRISVLWFFKGTRSDRHYDKTLKKARSVPPVRQSNILSKLYAIAPLARSVAMRSSMSGILRGAIWMRFRHFGAQYRDLP
jgi:hypothetical protein